MDAQSVPSRGRGRGQSSSGRGRGKTQSESSRGKGPSRGRGRAQPTPNVINIPSPEKKPQKERVRWESISADEYSTTYSFVKFSDDLKALLLRKYNNLTQEIWDVIMGSARMHSAMIAGNITEKQVMDEDRIVNEFGVSMEDIAAASSQVIFEKPPYEGIPPTTFNIPGDTGIVTIGSLSFEITSEVYDSLMKLIPGKEDEKAPKFYDTFLKYALLGLGTELFSLVGRDMYKWIRKSADKGVTVLECFASPFDVTYKKSYCSIHQSDPGSKGNFFIYLASLLNSQNATPHLFVAHPPDNEAIVINALGGMMGYILKSPRSGIILFLERPNKYLDNTIAEGNLGLKISLVTSKGYFIYLIGRTPDISFLQPKDIDNAKYTGSSFVELLTGSNQDIVKRLRGLIERTLRDIISGHLLASVYQELGVNFPETDLEIYDRFKLPVDANKETKARFRSKAIKASQEPIKDDWSISTDASARARRRAEEMSPYIIKLKDMEGGYLDVGCADGSISVEVANIVSPSVIIGADVKDYIHPSLRDRISFAESSDTLYNSLKDSSLKLVTAIVALHHISNIKAMIQNIYRALIPGGVFFIREHEFPSDDAQGMIFVGHMFYSYVVGDKSYDEALEMNALYPRTKEDLIDFITSVGFKLENVIDMKTNDFIYHAQFIKM